MSAGVEVRVMRAPGGQLVAADEESLERLNKFKTGTVLKTHFKKVRNYVFHKKFFAMRNCAFDNQEAYTDKEEFRKALIVAAGYYEEFRNLDGTVSRVAKSINFDAMDDLQFGELYAAVFNVILNQVLPGADAMQFQMAVDELMEFAH